MKRNLLLYGISVLVGAAISLIIVSIRGIFTLTDSNEVIRYLIDALFAVGAIGFCFGLLVLFSNLGAFSMLRYGLYRFGTIFKRDPSKVKFRTYYDYLEATREKKTPYGFLLIVGAIFIIASLILIPFWHRPEI